MSGLDKRHLLGVLAHELGHLRNRDTIYLTITYAMDRLGQLILNLVILLNGALNILALIPIVNIVIRIIQIVLLVMIAAVEYVLRLPKWITYYFVAVVVSMLLMRTLYRLAWAENCGMDSFHWASQLTKLVSLKMVNYMIVKVRDFLVGCLLLIQKLIKRIQRIDEGVEVYELKESLMWNRLLRK